MGAVLPLRNRAAVGGKPDLPYRCLGSVGLAARQDSSAHHWAPRIEMLLRDLVLRRGCCWPSLLLHCALHPLWGFVQVTHAEPQKSCSKVTDSCQHICQCRPPPPLPPPPPPPPPPRLLSAPAPNSTSCPAEDSWWSGLVIIIAVVCASLVFLTVLVIICYKAIKRKPLRKDENGTSVAEYPMSSSQSSKGVDVNTAVV